MEPTQRKGSRSISTMPTGPVEGGKQNVLWAAVNGQYLTVRFFYGTDLPTDAQFAAAQTELNNLIVPALPPSR